MLSADQNSSLLSVNSRRKCNAKERKRGLSRLVRSVASTAGGLTIIRCLAKYRNVNAVFKALSDPTRRRVLQLLRERPMSAGALARHFTVSKPTMSAHFSVLQQAGLIEAERLGRTIVYRLKMPVLEEALLGFARTCGWEMHADAASHPRPLTGEA